MSFTGSPDRRRAASVTPCLAELLRAGIGVRHAGAVWSWRINSATSGWPMAPLAPATNTFTFSPAVQNRPLSVMQRLGLRRVRQPGQSLLQCCHLLVIGKAACLPDDVTGRLSENQVGVLGRRVRDRLLPFVFSSGEGRKVRVLCLGDLSSHAMQDHSSDEGRHSLQFGQLVVVDTRVSDIGRKSALIPLFKVSAALAGKAHHDEERLLALRSGKDDGGSIEGRGRGGWDILRETVARDTEPRNEEAGSKPFYARYTQTILRVAEKDVADYSNTNTAWRRTA